MTTAAFKKLRRAVFERAENNCEGGCGRWITPDDAHLDHFFGRVRRQESVSNCWALCITCDHAKTNNQPSAEHWLNRFIVHCETHGYLPEIELAEARLDCLKAKGLTK